MKQLFQEKLYNIKKSITKCLYGFMYFLRDPYGAILELNEMENQRYSWLISDRLFVKCQYRHKMGKSINLRNPKSVTEKLLWLKLHDKNPLYTQLVDKYGMKRYIEDKVGSGFTIPTIGYYSSFENINFDELPNQFVLKCTHDSGSVCICKDKKSFNIELAKSKLNARLKQSHYKRKREWPYKNVKPAIICEEYLENPDGTPLVDYKFYCYGGEPRYFMYSLGEAEHCVKNHKFDMNLMSIDHLFKSKPTIDKEQIELPPNIEEMIELVKILCKDFIHVRVDLYSVNNRIYVGELTFYSGSGFVNIENEDYEKEISSYILLRRRS